MKDGRPAFPISYQHSDGSPDYIDGMTLRYYTAVEAMKELIRDRLKHKETYIRAGIAADAFAMADAMLSENDK